MKKLIFGIAILGLAVACKKVPAGGNHSVIKRDASVEHYSDDEQEAKPEVAEPVPAAEAAPATNTEAASPAKEEAPKADSVQAK
ncbi:MAG: hypothetical protein JSS94_09395 [Bacteroidetes bacterium]|nr:hypothetical protein [Bacteroidota bacterium]